MMERKGEMQQRGFTHIFSPLADLDFILNCLLKYKEKSLLIMLDKFVFFEEENIMGLIAKTLEKLLQVLEEVIDTENCFDVCMLMSNLLCIKPFRKTIK